MLGGGDYSLLTDYYDVLFYSAFAFGDIGLPPLRLATSMLCSKVPMVIFGFLTSNIFF